MKRETCDELPKTCSGRRWGGARGVKNRGAGVTRKRTNLV